VRSARYPREVNALGTELAQALGDLLQRGNRARLYDGMLAQAPESVDEHNYPVLSGLARVGPSTAARLAAEIGLDRSRVSRHADRFEAIGWLTRKADPADAEARYSPSLRPATTSSPHYARAWPSTSTRSSPTGHPASPSR